MAIQFNGSTQYLQWTAGTGLSLSYPFSMVCWMAVDGSTGGAQHAAMLQSSSATQFATLSSTAGLAAIGQVYDGSNFANAEWTGSPTADANLRLLILVATSASNHRAYWVDNTRSPVDTTSLTDRTANYNRVTIGARNAGGSLMQFLNGAVAEFHLFNFALTSGDITTLAGLVGGSVGPESATLSASGHIDGWTLENNSALTSINGRVLTAIGSPTTSGKTHPISRGGDTTAPVLSSPTGTGGVGVCSGTVSTDEANGTLYAVATASATQPSVAQIKAGQNHTGAAALRVVSQAVSATGTQTIASGAISGGAGTRYLHYVHTDAAANDSNRVSSASFSVTAALAVTLDALVDESGNPRAAYLVDKVWAIRVSDNTLVATWTAQTTNGSGVLPALSNAGLTAVPHEFVTYTATGLRSGAKVYTPA
jgi:hypothetical protein